MVILRDLIFLFVSGIQLTAEADKQISLDSDASGKEVDLSRKLKLGAEHMVHSGCVEGSVSSFEGIIQN